MATNKTAESTIKRPTYAELAKQLVACQSRNEAIEVMKQLHKIIDQLMATGDYKLSTKSKDFSLYIKAINKLTKENLYNEELLDIYEKTGKKQHFVINQFLRLTSEEKSALTESRQQEKLASAGVKEDGSFEKRSNIKISVSDIFSKISDWYLSNEAEKLAVYILLGTGLRGSNICVPTTHDDDGYAVNREMLYWDTFMISMNAIAKKRNKEKYNRYIIQTLLPAKNIVYAFNRLITLSEIKAIESEDKFTDSGVRSSIRRLIGDYLPEFKATEDDKGCIHNIRGFYACVTYKLYREKLNHKPAKLLVQENLVHESDNMTQIYLEKFDQENLIDIPTIPVELNIKEVGIIEQNTPLYESTTDDKSENDLDPVETDLDPVEEIVDTVENIAESNSEYGLNFAKILSKLSQAEQEIIAQELHNNSGEIEDILVESLKAFCQSKPKNHKASDSIVKIFDAINEYNSQCQNPTQKVVTGLALTEKIYQSITNGKSLTRKYFRIKYDENKEEIMKYLGDISYNDLNSHNGKYHKKDFPQIISKIVEIYHQM